MVQTQTAHQREAHDNASTHIASAPSVEADTVYVTKPFPLAKGVEAKIPFPNVFRGGHVCDDSEALQLFTNKFRNFKTNLAASIARQGKKYTPDEVVKLFNAYKPGAPRDGGGGQTLHNQAVLAYVREWAEARNMDWPEAKKYLPDGLSMRKATQAQKDVAYATADAKVEALIAKFDASVNPEIVAGIKRHEDALRAKRTASQAADDTPTVTLDADSISV